MVVPDPTLVQQLNHRYLSGCVAEQQLGPAQLAGTAANDNTSANLAAWICAGEVWRSY